MLLALVPAGLIVRFVTHHAHRDAVPPRLSFRETRVEGGHASTGAGVPEVGCVVGETEAGVCTCSRQGRAWALSDDCGPLCEAQCPPAGGFPRSGLSGGHTRSGAETAFWAVPGRRRPLPWEACALGRGPLFHREDRKEAESRAVSGEISPLFPKGVWVTSSQHAAQLPDARSSGLGAVAFPSKSAADTWTRARLPVAVEGPSQRGGRPQGQPSAEGLCPIGPTGLLPARPQSRSHPASRPLTLDRPGRVAPNTEGRGVCRGEPPAPFLA